MKILRRCSALLLCLAVLVSMAPQALAYGRIDLDQPVSLTVHHDRAGVNYKLYYAASISKTARFDMAQGQFAAYAEDLQPLVDAGDWDLLIARLEPRVYGLTPVASGKTEAKGGGAQVTFTGLEPGLYLVMADPDTIGSTTYFPASSLVSLPNLDPNDNWDYAVDITAKPDTPITEPDVDITVEKIWAKVDGISHPNSVQVQLLQDGRPYGKAVTLNAGNKWTHTWHDLPVGHRWTVEEVDVPANYRPSYDSSGIGSRKITIVNTYDPERPAAPPEPPGRPTLPQTGQLWWPVPLLAAAGMVCFLIGWLKRRRTEME